MPLQSLPFFSRCAQAPSVPLCAALITSHSLWVLVDPLCSPTCALEPHSSHPCMLPIFSTPLCAPPVPAIISECLTSKPWPLHMLSNSLCSLLAASRSPQTHSVNFQTPSDALHSYPAAFTSSPFPSLCFLGTLLLSSLHGFSPFPLLYAQVSFIPLSMHSDLLCSSPLFPSLHIQISITFSVYLVLTSPLCAHSHPPIPQVPSDSPRCPPSTLRSHLSLLCVLSSNGFCCQIPSSPSVHPQCPLFSVHTHSDLHSLSVHTGSGIMLSPLCTLRPLHPLCTFSDCYCCPPSNQFRSAPCSPL